VSIANVARFLRPADLAGAIAAVRSGAIPVSGGTDVMLHPPARPTELVDLTALPLNGIESYEGGLRIGATTTLTAMLEDPRVAAIGDGVVTGMLAEVGSPLLRNRATVGGHLARGRLSDVIPVLLDYPADYTSLDGRANFIAGDFNELAVTVDGSVVYVSLNGTMLGAIGQVPVSPGILGIVINAVEVGDGIEIDEFSVQPAA